MSATPRLRTDEAYPRTVDGAVHCPVVEQNVRDRLHAATFPEAADGQPVAGEAAVAVKDLDIARAVDHRHAVVTIFAKIPVDGDVLPRHVQAVRVEREALRSSQSVRPEQIGMRGAAHRCDVPCSISRTRPDVVVLDADVLPRLR